MTKICKTGLLNVLDIAYKVDSGTIWAVNGNGMHIIDHNNDCKVDEFPQVGHLFRHVRKRQVHPRNTTLNLFFFVSQDYTTRFPQDKLVGIVFNPVTHVPIVLTAGVFDANGAVLSFPTLYRFILANGTEVFQATTNITDGAPVGGTLMCKRKVFSPSPTFAPPTARYVVSTSWLACFCFCICLLYTI